VYEQSVALSSAEPVVGVVLPNVSIGAGAGSAALHVFALTVGG
jgi:hypothetical protein